MKLNRLVNFAACGIAIVLCAGTPLHATCGDGIIDPGEDCDDGSQNGSTNSCCLDTCKFSGKTPDVIVGDLVGTTTWGTVGGITAFSIGTTSCNLGSCWLNWISSTPEHPVIGQNMFRLENGRFEQIGQSWLKHGYTALAGSVCSNSCIAPPNGQHLGVNCSDPYSSSLNGSQTRLGPKDDVDANTGVFPYPDPRIGTTGDAIFKRLQVHDEDLDTTLHPGAVYFVEGQYVTHDDATAKNNGNNASYRSVTVGSAPSYPLTLTGSTHREEAGIQAWKDTDPSVTETSMKVDGGTFIVSAKATPLGGGMYHYEYAVQNLTNQRAGQAFTVPLPPGTFVTNVGFHDVDYHSGTPYVGTDWTAIVFSDSVNWSTQTYAANPDANALRWGTLYNFRFDADVGPGSSSVVIGFFRPGTPSSVSIPTVVPGPCVGRPDGTACSDDDACTQTDSCQSGYCTGSNPVVCAPLDQCHQIGTCDSATGLCSNPDQPNGTACDDLDACTTGDACTDGVCTPTGLAVPGEVDPSVLVSVDVGVATITWTPATDSTASSVLRGLVSGLPVGPGGGDEVCLADGVAGGSATDPETPAADEAFWYLVRGSNSCGDGPYGFEVDGGTPTPRASTTCP